MTDPDASGADGLPDFDVSRETPLVPPASAAARGVFDVERLPALQRYAELLATEGVLRGLIGPRETPRLWDRHLVNCGLLLQLVPPGATVVDLGSGAGLPGLVLALARPDLRVTLVEPLLRRTAFLDEAVETLAATNVEVVRARAEELHGERVFDVVTSRALAPLTRLLGWSMPLVAPKGSVLALKGAGAAIEVEAARADLAAWRSQAEVVTATASDGLSTALVVRVAWDVGAPVGWQPSRSTTVRHVRSGHRKNRGGGRSGHALDRGSVGAAGRARRKDSS